MELNKLFALFWHFTFYSLLAVGGVSSTLFTIHHYLVESTHWIRDDQFFALYTIAQIAPGPNLQIVTLFGYQVAGLIGGLVTLLGMCGPSSLLAIFFEHTTNLYHTSIWSSLIRKSMTPIAIGLLFANGYTIAFHVDGVSFQLIAITCITILLNIKTKLHPLILIAGGAVIGATFI
ncbi:MAG: hypothetical protein RL017_596 [Pseudomonadota bacterium]|jgi:chromate transporter|nr:chromate transporter [Burkholderiales bacterium]